LHSPVSRAGPGSIIRAPRAARLVRWDEQRPGLVAVTAFVILLRALLA